jgi:hypothetical protein
MTNSWEDFLDIIKLNTDIRLKANLQILMNFPNGYSNKSLLLGLFDQIEVLYRKKKCIILWWDDRRRVYTKVIGRDDLMFLHYLWDRKAGDYLLFLPEEFYEIKTNIEDEEEFIGKCLEKYSQLILKTEDAYVALYLYLDK